VTPITSRVPDKEKFMNLQRFGVAAALIVVLALPVTAFAGGKHGGGTPTAAGCSVSGNVVQASGLPAGQLINFMVSSAAGSTGWVLGYTTDGTWSVTVPARSGSTTYQFVSTTSGPNGSKYTVFAACSA
jgi:hypothetical protein